MNRQTETEIQFQEGMQKIYDFARDIAKQEGIKLKSLRLVDGLPLGCIDCHELDIAAGGSTVSVMLYRNEVEDYPGHAGIDLTQAKIHNAIDRLKLQLEG